VKLREALKTYPRMIRIQGVEHYLTAFTTGNGNGDRVTLELLKPGPIVERHIIEGRGEILLGPCGLPINVRVEQIDMSENVEFSISAEAEVALIGDVLVVS
jgi:hypothetical protein